ncbi:pyruvate kinase [Sphaerisporangium sp. TRM90804]|uniref:pyruvate kinase n=1 Tax=Sphaerisporangium sp. TRM90804 TaxID=3031113 RepID=UPI00244BDA6A|nr:pyruvate kinase [Sphaerisporangium sp. TRM90804]MDH2428548.1 pyruvate kinase [Sphaerisporangium sp. TRM90804]
MSRRSKIVCTLGPATSSPERLRELIAAGMNVARFNLSHGSHELHKEVHARVREAAAELGKAVGVLADLQGPKIRVGRFAEGPVRLGFGDVFTITTEDVPGDRDIVSTTYDGLPTDVGPGDRILVDDGRLVLETIEVDGPRVVTKVLVGGMISDNKGLNLPGVAVSAPPLTEKDEEDLRWALRTGFDMIALSFVRSPDDAALVRAIMDEEGVHLPLLAKIEKPQAVECLEEIVDAFDGIMVARGDLGVELPLEQVPIVQRRAIALSREKAHPVIVATQMLDSMMSAPRPTRAEASDVAYAVMDGADAVMLSGETSVGGYPIESVATMARIASAAEAETLQSTHTFDRLPETTGGAIARAAAEVGAIVGAKALCAFTMSGETARRLARYRSPIPLLAFTSAPEVRGQLALTWGVETFEVPFVHHTDDMVRQVESALLSVGRCEKGDKVVIVAGSPPGSHGSTNALRVHTIGSLLSSGTG